MRSLPPAEVLVPTYWRKLARSVEAKYRKRGDVSLKRAAGVLRTPSAAPRAARRQ